MMTRSPLLLGLVGTFALAACGPDASGNRPDAPPYQPRCGNMVVEGAEQCDDGNTISNDGCSKDCNVEQVSPPVCGDSKVDQSEGCDDGGMAPDDGCSATCTVEPGYTCSGAPSTCTMPTGDVDGTCQKPFEITLADDGSGDLTGSGAGDTTNATSQVAAAACDGDVSGAGNDQVWKFVLPDTRDVYILMPSTVTFDAILRLQTAPCDTSTEIPEYTGTDGCSDQGIEMDTEALAYVKLPAGTYYVVVDGYDAAAKGTYELQIHALQSSCGDGVLDLLDFCDDGDSDDGDGCSSKCEIEDGWTCNGAEPSVCTMGGDDTAVPPAAGDLAINEIMIADNSSDTNCDGATNKTNDEFIELVNTSSKTLDLTGVTIDDDGSIDSTLGPRHTFGPSASGSLTLAPGKAVVVWGGGSPACAGVDDWFVASSGTLGFNDTPGANSPGAGISERITVRTAGASPVVIVQKDFLEGQVKTNISLTLDPDITGTSYIDHPMIGMRRWSPGRKQDDSAF